MPFSYEEEAIREYWGECGGIEALDIMRFPDTGRFKGMVFITFATQEAYENALAADGSDLDGQTLRVRRWNVAQPLSAQPQEAVRTGVATCVPRAGSVQAVASLPDLRHHCRRALLVVLEGGPPARSVAALPSAALWCSR